MDSYATLKRFKEELDLPFDLLSDWFREVSRRWSTYNEQEGVSNRRTFLIDKEGVIRLIQSSALDEPRRHEEILNAVRQMEETR